MAVRNIVLIGDEVLRKKARRIREFDADLHQLLDDLHETLDDAQGAGLAAPQVGVSQRVLVVHLNDDEEEFGELAGQSFEVINPEFAKTSRDMVEGYEGCLSIPGYIGNVNRHQSVVVKGQDRHGKDIRIKAYDWMARIFQHEMDHLDGVLYIDLTDEVYSTKDNPDEPTDTTDESVETTSS